jgi:arylsulfatase A-like enzyme
MTRTIVRLTCVLSAIAALPVLTHSAEPRRPNVLVIVADDLGYGELSCQGNPQVPTPNIDSLARSGVRFTSGYVSGPYCSPTRCGLLTGRYQQRTGHEFNAGPAEEAPEQFGLALGEKTLADRLKEAGYVTGMFGKWHLGFRPEFHPTRRGFDEFFGFLGGAHDYLDAHADATNLIQRGTKAVDTLDPGYATDAFAGAAAAFIETHRDRPWFVYLPFNAVHAPLQATDKYLARFASIADPRRRTFAAMLSALDDGVGTVLAKLRALKLEDDTLIVFVSDNGGPTLNTTSGNGPLHGYKAQVWEGGIRVPFMMQWKGHVPAGTVYDRPVIQLDVVPTVLAAVGSPVSAGAKFDGVNLLPYLASGDRGSPHAVLFWRFTPQRAVRAGDWKLTDMGEGPMLFNLADDLGENHDLAARMPEKVKELETAYKAWNADNIEARWGKRVRAGAAARKKAAARKATAKKAAAP